MDSGPPNSSVPGILQERILEWVAKPSSRGLSQPRAQTQVSCVAGRIFTVWATREAHPVSLLIFSLDDLSFDVSGVLKSPLLIYFCQFLPLLHIISLYKYVLHFIVFG